MKSNEMVRIGIYEKALPSSADWHQMLTTAKRAGYAFVEMSIDESDARLSRLDWSVRERAQFHRTVLDEGVPVLSICLSGHRRFPMGSADPAVRQRGRDIMAKAIDFALDCGIRTIQLAGYDVYYEPSTADTRARFRDSMWWTAELAAKAQVMVAMEIMDYPLMNSIARWLPYAEQAASPWFCVYPDVGNLSAWWNDVPAELKANIRNIVAIHLKDTLPVGPEFPGKFREVPFGTGCVNFPAVFRALAEVHYKGAFLIEMWNGAAADPFEEIVKAREWMLARMKEGGLISNSQFKSEVRIEG